MSRFNDVVTKELIDGDGWGYSNGSPQNPHHSQATDVRTTYTAEGRNQNSNL